MDELSKTMKAQYDIMVVRGSLEGCVAAVAKAREGKSVVLIEKHGSLGGMASNGLASWMEPYAAGGNTALMRTEILERLGCKDGAAGALYPDQRMKIVLGEMLKDAGVTSLNHVYLSRPVFSGESLQGFSANGKTGRIQINCARVIDASDTLETAGMLGLQQTAFSGSVSVSVKMNGLRDGAVKMVSEPSGGRIGSLHVPLQKYYYGLRFFCDELCVMLRDKTGEALVSGLRCVIPSFDPLSLSAAQAGLRRFAYDLRDHMRESVRNMESINIIHVAPQMNAYGIRQCENGYPNLTILNNGGNSYSNVRALENGCNC